MYSFFNQKQMPVDKQPYQQQQCSST